MVHLLAHAPDIEDGLVRLVDFFLYLAHEVELCGQFLVGDIGAGVLEDFEILLLALFADA